jgi:hypothetical protein
VLKLSHAGVAINLGTGGQPQANAEAGSVTIRLTASCAQPTGNGQVIDPGVRRFRTQGPAGTPQVVDVVPGGCLTYQPDPGIGPSDPLLDQAQHAVPSRPVRNYATPSNAVLPADSTSTPKAAASTAISQQPRASCPSCLSLDPPIGYSACNGGSMKRVP